MKLFFIPILLAFLSLANASSVIGLVQKVDGKVKVKHEDSLKKLSVKAGLELQSGDLLTTSKESTTVLKLVDGSILALDASSTIHFLSDKDAEQTSGKVFYKITSRDAKNSLKIKTPFAIIGIKGTTFVVNATENASIKLKEGLIGVRSLKEEYNLYRKELAKEFEDYNSGNKSEFEEFKSKEKKRIAEVTKEFDLEAGNSVSFMENQVDEKAWSEEDEKEFAYFENLIKNN